MAIDEIKYQDGLKKYGQMFHEYGKGRWKPIISLRKRLGDKNSKVTREEYNHHEKKAKKGIRDQLYYLAKAFLRENHLPFTDVSQAMSYISKEAHNIKAQEKQEKKEKGLEGKL